MPASVKLGLKFVERCATAAAAEAVSDFRATIRQWGFSVSACGAWAGIAVTPRAFARRANGRDRRA